MAFQFVPKTIKGNSQLRGKSAELDYFRVRFKDTPQTMTVLLLTERNQVFPLPPLETNLNAS